MSLVSCRNADDHASGRVGSHDGIGIDLQHEFVESGIDSDDVSYLMMHL